MIKPIEFFYLQAGQRGIYKADRKIGTKRMKNMKTV